MAMFEVNWSKEPLEIKYRLVDVDTLICVACQEFLSLIITTDKWQEKLFKIAKESTKRKPASNKKESSDTNESTDKDEKYEKYDKYNKYVNIYESMKDLENVSQFSVEYLDLTMINEIVWNRPELIAGKDKDKDIDINIKTKSRLLDLLNDRNETCHSHKHETPEELYARGISYLDHLKKFVKEVEKRETKLIPDDSIRETYRKKYVYLIRSLQKTMYEENRNIASPIINDTAQDVKPTKRIQRDFVIPAGNVKTKTLTSYDENEIRKKDLTVGGVAGTKKMRLGRVHKKKTDSSATTD